MSDPAPPLPDKELLHLAANLLQSEDYATQLVEAESEYPLVLAENRLFVLVIAATPTIGDFDSAESLASRYIADRLAGLEVGAKRWDICVVLLTGQMQGHGTLDGSTLYGLNYDTRGVRRLARTGVIATPAGVRDALRPFVPPIDYGLVLDDEDPFRSLADAMSDRGIARELVDRAVAAFRDGGDVSSAF